MTLFLIVFVNLFNVLLVKPVIVNHFQILAEIRYFRIEKMSKKRKWSDAYVKYGFTLKVGSDGIERPQCMTCDKLLSNSSLKSCKLNQHFLNVH